MKRFHALALLATFMIISATSFSQEQNKTKTNTKEMKSFLIEREIPEAGKLTPEQLKGISQTSCKVLREMGPRIEWVHSYVTGNKIYCIYRAESADLIREHAKKGGFPANSIVEIANLISPATAN